MPILHMGVKLLYLPCFSRFVRGRLNVFLKTMNRQLLISKYYHITLSFEMQNSDHIVFVQCSYNQGQIAQLNSAIKEYDVLFCDYKEQVG